MSRFESTADRAARNGGITSEIVSTPGEPTSQKTIKVIYLPIITLPKSVHDTPLFFARFARCQTSLVLHHSCNGL